MTIAIQGDFGKPRPALIVQSDLFSKHTSVTVLLITSKVVEAPLMRVDVHPTEENGLRAHSQIEVDKAFTMKREKIGGVIGELDNETMLTVNRLMLVFLGLA